MEKHIKKKHQEIHSCLRMEERIFWLTEQNWCNKRIESKIMFISSEVNLQTFVYDFYTSDFEIV